MYMRRALALGRAQKGRTGDNPAVGCVIVRNGEIVGQAATCDGGRPHAEMQALAMAGACAEGGCVYVTLEPCAHYGQTPPCAQALIEAAIERCVIALIDPNPLTCGQGIALLRQAGIVVEVGLEAAEAQRLHQVFTERFQ